MGLGKTIQAIALIGTSKEQMIANPHYHLPPLLNYQLAIRNIQAPGQISHQSLPMDFTLHCVGYVTSASRQRQSSHVSHENVTQSQTHFNTICNVWVISPHWLPHPHLICPDASHAYAPTPPSR
ncbi:hypothetical protein O181_107231 [Austropuccinia psidii MF-1]|uniref:Uncharacterized protein n=1 Tax=Austropuccinia psidii MF-1 TaxID=1389203 RepID=A0A9Q3PNY1_9BASI|nr:hypothetical protein [Austropuccinia psidii MF-1]